MIAQFQPFVVHKFTNQKTVILSSRIYDSIEHIYSALLGSCFV